MAIKKTICISWHVDDVHSRVDELGYEKITDEEAMTILEGIAQTHDATIGVNWDVIDIHIE